MATYQACQVIGMPECRINLAHLVSYLSEAPKSTRSYAAYGRYVPSQQFRPLSIMSEMSVHSPVKEDDTMITVSPSAGAVVMMMMLMRCF